MTDLIGNSLTSIKGVCGTVLHTVWKIEKNPNRLEAASMIEMFNSIKAFKNYEKDMLEKIREKEPTIFAQLPEEFRNQYVNDSTIEVSNNQVDSTKSPTLNDINDHETHSNENSNAIVDCQSNDLQTIESMSNDSLQTQAANLNLDNIMVKSNTHGVDETTESGENLVPIDSYHLLLHAIEQLSGGPVNLDVANVSSVPEQSNNMAEFDIQAEETVTTTQETAEHTYAKIQPKKSEENFKSDMNVSHKYERLSMSDMRTLPQSHSDISSSMNGELGSKSKLAKAMEKRKSATRKSICTPRNSFDLFDNEEEVDTFSQQIKQKNVKTDDEINSKLAKAMEKRTKRKTIDISQSCDFDDELNNFSRQIKHKKSNTDNETKLAKAMQKRKSDARKTIHSRPSIDDNDNRLDTFSRHFKQKESNIDHEAKSKLAKAMEKRKSRKTICIPREDDEMELDDGRRNTNSQMYAMNTMFQDLCVFCNKQYKRSLVQHYVQQHPDHEVPISRPSPTMAKKLRKKLIKHRLVGNKIVGKCVFCEEEKPVVKSHWETHYLVHTGEHIFACSNCKKMMKKKSDHKINCPGTPLNIFRLNDNHAAMGYMCKDCNYFQVWRNNIITHLENEHGYMGPQENYHFEKLTLIPKRDLIHVSE